MQATALAVLAAAAVISLPGQTGSGELHRMEITLEQERDGGWEVVDPGLVLENGDLLRFRFRANFEGYLYVMNQGSSGKSELLYPREETGEDNRILAGQEYRIPATQAWFRVAGPPGYDTVYWLVTPLRLGSDAAPPEYVPLPPPPPKPVPPENLLPRCDDSIFRARGVCVDSKAGPRNVDRDSELPSNLAGVARLRSRELIIMHKGQDSTISTPASESGPVLYEFRLAHK